ncbi:hypothetical protein GP486_002566 [Trichoglossum hirsutum]|uniref:Borealin N-terminal domain-containing protein n=1 Tax=Trichoglossum hirsutum TaxID=265104 RepID=A0A9P8RRZ6_9PEZI|nr:hypothetical protein GP486_002566 [Trichoglossum hirsutum]
MAPLRSKTRKGSDSSTSSASRDVQDSSFSTRAIAAKTRSPAARTPAQAMSPIQKRRKAITQARKQAKDKELTVNDHAVSERARKLRAQYSLQAQGLKTRIEIRINRIPMALRKANIGELLAKYSEEQEPSNASKIKVASATTAAAIPASEGVTRSTDLAYNASPLRGTKRPSNEISSDADKENDSNVDLSLPKKRTKAAAAPAGSTRTTSRSKPAASQVLSPKSSNSNAKNPSRSPIRLNDSPAKSLIARPVSPLKSVATAPAATGVIAGMVEKIKSTRTATTRKITPAAPAPVAGAGRGKRTATHIATTNTIGRGRAASNSSHTSASTTGTVITRFKGKASVPTKAAGTEKKARSTTGRAGGLTAAAKKAAAASVAAAAAMEVPAAGKRILRKRK